MDAELLAQVRRFRDEWIEDRRPEVDASRGTWLEWDEQVRQYEVSGCSVRWGEADPGPKEVLERELGKDSLASFVTMDIWRNARVKLETLRKQIPPRVEPPVEEMPPLEDEGSDEEEVAPPVQEVSAVFTR